MHFRYFSSHFLRLSQCLFLHFFLSIFVLLTSLQSLKFTYHAVTEKRVWCFFLIITTPKNMGRQKQLLETQGKLCLLFLKKINAYTTLA